MHVGSHPHLYTPNIMIEYYVGRGNEKFGPYDESQTKSMFAEGRISPQDLLWRSDFADWLSAESVLAAPQPVPAAMPMPMPVPAPAPAPAFIAPTAPAAVDQIELSPKWKRRFALIEKAGGAKMPAFKTLTFGERYCVNINWLAFFFGPFYFFCLGMWKRGLTLCGIAIVGSILLDLVFKQMGMSGASAATSSSFAGLFALRANIAYYKTIILKDDGAW